MHVVDNLSTGGKIKWMRIYSDRLEIPHGTFVIIAGLVIMLHI